MATDFWIALPGDKYDPELGWPCSALGIPSAKIEEFRLGGRTLPLEQVRGDKHHLRLVTPPAAQSIPDAAAKIRLSKRLVTFEGSIVVAFLTLLGTLGTAYYGYRKDVEEHLPQPADATLKADNMDLKKRLHDAEVEIGRLQSDLQTKSAKPEQPAAPIAQFRLAYKFNDIVIRAVPAGSGHFYTSATLRIDNSGSEPIEVAIDAIGRWPTLVVDGTTMQSDNRTISMPFFMNGTLIDCARQRQSRFATLQPGEPYTTSIGFAAQAAPGSMDASKRATLVGSLLIRTPKSTECTNVSIPGAEIPVSFAK